MLLFLATFYVIRKDAKVRRYQQARKIALFVERTEVAGPDGRPQLRSVVRLRNMSDEPIYDATFFLKDKRKRIDFLITPHVILPQDQTTYDSGERWISDNNLDVWFRDNTGKWWDRTLRGTLKEKTRFRHWLEVNFHFGWSLLGWGKGSLKPRWRRFKNGVARVYTSINAR
jgi:hypothetical protein